MASVLVRIKIRLFGKWGYFDHDIELPEDWEEEWSLEDQDEYMDEKIKEAALSSIQWDWEEL